MAAYPIPMLPVYERRAHHAAGQPLGDFGAAGHVTLLRSGRLAQLEALKAVLGPRRAVLVPAYHCLSMIEPVVALDAQPVFYRLTPTLDPDLDHLTPLLKDVDAIVAVHFFGVPRELSALRALCDTHGVALIEDCAHTLFGGVGGSGDFAIASLRKFYPLFDGGAVRANRETSVATSARRWAYELKAVKNTLETAAAYGRLGRRPPPTAAAAVPPTPAHPVALPDPRRATYVDPRYGVDHSLAPMSLMARRQLFATDVPGMRERRTAIAARLYDCTRQLQHMQPFLDTPDDAVVPYVFLLRLARPARDFARLKTLGLPIWRWDALASDVCPVSTGLRESLLQLPCHQGLRDDEVEQMCAWLHNVDTAS